MTDVDVIYDREEALWKVQYQDETIATTQLKQSAEKEGRAYARRVKPSKLRVFNKLDKITYTTHYGEN